MNLTFDHRSSFLFLIKGNVEEAVVDRKIEARNFQTDKLHSVEPNFIEWMQICVLKTGSDAATNVEQVGSAGTRKS